MEYRLIFIKYVYLASSYSCFCSLAKWLVPQKRTKKKEHNFSEKIKEMWEIRRRHMRSQWQIYAFLAFVFGINIILFILRAHYYKDMLMLNGFKPNVFYMISKACGNHNSLYQMGRRILKSYFIPYFNYVIILSC